MIYHSRYAVVPAASHTGSKITTGTSRKTLIQVATPSTQKISVFSWWVAFDGTSSSAAPIEVELIETNVAATVTSFTPVAFSDTSAPGSLCVGGTSATGTNASAEGTITASRLLDYQTVHPQASYRMEFSLGREPVIAVSSFLRLRVLAGASVGAACGIVWEE
jgi:hypothetical protein